MPIPPERIILGGRLSPRDQGEILSPVPDTHGYFGNINLPGLDIHSDVRSQKSSNLDSSVPGFENASTRRLTNSGDHILGKGLTKSLEGNMISFEYSHNGVTAGGGDSNSNLMQNLRKSITNKLNEDLGQALSALSSTDKKSESEGGPTNSKNNFDFLTKKSRDTSNNVESDDSDRQYHRFHGFKINKEQASRASMREKSSKSPHDGQTHNTNYTSPGSVTGGSPTEYDFKDSFAISPEDRPSQRRIKSLDDDQLDADHELYMLKELGVCQEKSGVEPLKELQRVQKTFNKFLESGGGLNRGSYGNCSSSSSNPHDHHVNFDKSCTINLKKEKQYQDKLRDHRRKSKEIREQLELNIAELKNIKI